MKETFKIKGVNVNTIITTNYELTVVYAKKEVDFGFIDTPVKIRVKNMTSSRVSKFIIDENSVKDLYDRVRDYIKTNFSDELLCAGSLKCLWYRGVSRLSYVYATKSQSLLLDEYGEFYVRPTPFDHGVAYVLKSNNLFAPAPVEMIQNNECEINFEMDKQTSSVSPANPSTTQEEQQQSQ